ncbi:methyl-accepting chemotaxis protein [Roseibium sp.]|uniref:methyl-accepting chemotaxis protein n=1 Tax=Roseibium sp. TaxID=1936156 RepID=UPI003A9748DE
MTFRFLRLPSLPLRLKIMSLAVLTAGGLAIVGSLFLWSQNQVAGAFQRLEESVELTRVVSDLSEHAQGMQVLEKSYVAVPEPRIYETFLGKLQETRLIAQRISGMSVAEGLGSEVADVIDTLDGAEGAFAQLDTLQQTIGYTSEDGLRVILNTTANDIQRRLKKEMNFGGGPDFEKLARAVLAIQLAEKEYLGEETDLALGNFEVAFGRFERLLKKVYLPNDIKKEIGTKMTSYREAFDAYTVAAQDRARSAELLDTLFDLIPPHVKSLNEAAQNAEIKAENMLVQVRRISSAVMIGVIVGLLVGLTTLALFIGRSISLPMTRMQTAMEALASGASDIVMPEERGGRELEAMARTVAIFRENAIERDRLAEGQQRDNAARDARVESVENLITKFEETVGDALGSLDVSTEELVKTSKAVENAADEATDQASRAGDAVRLASENVNSAASASEELAASITEISGQATRSTEVAKQALDSAQGTYTTMDELSQAAVRIGEVMGLIRDIANQTNLLALNATIEAARAGEAGKGFAVVAAEVKQLADQTARATGDIETQVEAIQGTSTNAMNAIEHVTAIISDMESLAGSVASAVQQQDTAVQDIAQNVAQASQKSEQGAGLMETVVNASEHSRKTGTDVDRVASSLAAQVVLMRQEISRFLTEVRAA